MATLLKQMPQMGEVFRLDDSSSDPGYTGFGIYTEDGIKEFNLKTELSGYQRSWEGAIESIKRITGTNIGNWAATIPDPGEGSKAFHLGGKTYQLEKRKVGNTQGIFMISPDGKATQLTNGGFSKAALVGAMAKATVDVPEGVNIGYNQDPQSQQNIQALVKSYGLGESVDGMNTYLKGLLGKYITGDVGASDITAHFEGSTQTDKGWINQTMAPQGTVQPTSDKPWDAENEADYQKYLTQTAENQTAMGDRTPVRESQDRRLFGEQLDPNRLTRQSGTRSYGDGTGDPFSTQQSPDRQLRDGTAYVPPGPGVGTNSTSGPASVLTAPTGSEGAMALVDIVFGSDLQNLQDYPGWTDSPYKQEAWEIINQIKSSPEALAGYVKSKGFENLQQYGWWNSSPHKTAAWQLVSSGQVGAPGVGSDPAVPTETDTGVVNNDPIDPALKSAYDIIDASNLTDEQKNLFKDVAKNWDPNSEVNVEGILREFENLKLTTIDPHYQEVTDLYTNDLKKSLAYQKQERDRQLEIERANEGQSIRQAKAGLEKSGMTFTGKAVEALGAESALPQSGNSAIPTQDSTAGYFYEGDILQSNRLISSSNMERYKRGLEQIGLGAERDLGSSQAAMLNIPGFSGVGNVKGNIEDSKQSEYASVLSQLAGQEQTNTQNRNPINYSF